MKWPRSSAEHHRQLVMAMSHVARFSVVHFPWGYNRYARWGGYR